MTSVARSITTEPPEPSVRNEAYSSGVSWAAVTAGAFGSAALSLILVALGAGMGLSSISPWSDSGLSAGTVGKGAIAWLILVQIIASAMGGYLAGRLRTKWVALHTHEVYFRDTAHGFLVWATGLVITVGLLASATTSLLGGPKGPQGGATSGLAASANEYYVDALFRTARPMPEANDPAIHAEVARILANTLTNSDMSSPDKAYLSALIATKTGLTEPEAERRISDTLAQARQMADSARKALAHSLYWMVVALLIGAFCASFAATLGGRQRDQTIT